MGTPLFFNDFTDPTRAANGGVWEGLVWDTKLPAVVLIAILIGYVPMWLVHRGSRWTQNRKIRSLEASVRSSTLSQQHEAKDRPATASPASAPAAPTPAPAPASTDLRDRKDDGGLAPEKP